MPDDPRGSPHVRPREAAGALVSVVIPVFNEQEVLPLLFEELRDAVRDLVERVEFVFVNDGSTDATGRLLADLYRRDDRTKVVNFSRNFGHQTAVSAGIHYAAGDCVGVMDGDLQDPPKHLRAMIEKWREGWDVVYAVRRSRDERLWKRACYRIFYRMLKRIAEIDVPIDAGDFCVMDRRVVDVLRRMPEQRRFVRALRSWAGFRQTGLEYDRPGRAAGTAKYSFWRLVHLGMSGVLGFSVAPLRVISLAGVLVGALSFALIGFYWVWRLCGFKVAGHRPQDVLGFFTLVCVVLFLGGMQLLALGVIGEYVGQTLMESKRRPLWVVESTLGIDLDEHLSEPD